MSILTQTCPNSLAFSLGESAHGPGAVTPQWADGLEYATLRDRHIDPGCTAAEEVTSTTGCSAAMTSTSAEKCLSCPKITTQSSADRNYAVSVPSQLATTIHKTNLILS